MYSHAACSPPPSPSAAGQCSSPTQVQCLFLPGQVVQAQAQTVNNGGEQTATTELKNAQTLPVSKRRDRKTDKEEPF